MSLVEQGRHLQRHRFQEGVDQGGQVPQEFPPEDVLLADHQSSNHDREDAAVVHSVEVVGHSHEHSHHQHEEDHELFEGHEGCEGHDGDAVGGEHVDGAHHEGVGGYSEQRGDLEYFLSLGGGAGEDDDQPLHQEDLRCCVCYSGVEPKLEGAKEISGGEGLRDGDESIERADKQLEVEHPGCPVVFIINCTGGTPLMAKG